MSWINKDQLAELSAWASFFVNIRNGSRSRTCGVECAGVGRSRRSRGSRGSSAPPQGEEER